MKQNLERLMKRLLLSVISALRPAVRIAPSALPTNYFKRILVVKQHDQLGDLLVATPAIRALRKKFPHAHISVVVREYTAPLMWENPNVDAVIVFYEQFKRWNRQVLQSFWQQLRSDGGYDCAIVMNSVSRSLSSDIIAVLSKAKYIVGPNHLTLDAGIPESIYNSLTPRSKKVQSEIDHYLDIVRAIGVPPDGYEYDLILTDDEINEAEKITYSLGIQSNLPLVGVHFGALNKEKRLPLDILARSIAWIKQQYACELILIVGPNEVQLSEQLVSKLDKKTVHVAPLSPLRVSSALIKKLSLLLCNDTGTMHIASALRVPTISFHSISDPVQWKPPHERHIGLRANDRKITSIKIDMITNAVDIQMQNLGIAKKSV